MAVVQILLAFGPAAPARAAVVDAVVAEFEGGVVTASDVALARALGAFGFQPSETAIRPEEVAACLDARLLAREAVELELGAADDLDAAWREAGARLGGLPVLTAWLERIDVSEAWARRTLTTELRRRRFIQIRFRDFAFVTDPDVDTALGPGPHAEADREAARQRLIAAEVERSLQEWLAEARQRARARVVLETPLPAPFPMPGGSSRAPDPGRRFRAVTRQTPGSSPRPPPVSPG